MKEIVKNLWLAVALILAASAVLLFSDMDQRQQTTKSQQDDFPKIAILQIASTPLLDMHVAGIMDRLQARGYAAPGNSNIRRYNPQGDFSTANTIAREIVNGPFEMVITSSTVALQVFSKANQQIGKWHVFGAVTDPFGTGVGISGPEPDQHPPYMTGVGTFQPVEAAFRILHEINPTIRKVGVVWNPGEQCSEACLLIARTISAELGIELIEAIAANTSEVSEATRSLLARGVEAIWVGGDTVASASINMMVNMAAAFNIPVFTNDPYDVKNGVLFGVGANYYTVGEYTADMAIAIMEGRNPASFRIENIVPEELALNKELLQNLGKDWRISQPVQERLAASLPEGEEEKISLNFADYRAKGNKPTLTEIKEANHFLNVTAENGKPAEVAFITLVENRLLEEADHGVEAGLQWSGLVAGVDYTIKRYSAQGETAQLAQIIDAVVRDKPDLIVTITTPVMMAVISKVKDIPVVFTVSSDPVKAKMFGSGCQSNVCGVHDDPPVDVLLDMADEYLGGLSKAGVVYDASQLNSVLSVEKLRSAAKTRDVEVLEATATSVVELGLATQSVIQRGAEVIIISADNLANTGFASIYRAAEAANVPVFTTEPQLVAQGATAAFGDDFFEWGKQSGKMAAKIIAGLPPSELPIVATQVQKRIDPVRHRKIKKTPAMLKLSLVHYSDTEFAERCHEGLIDGIQAAGFVEGKDYSLRVFNAQGDMSTLSSIMTTVKSDRVDLLMVISTPALQAAMRQAGDETKIVFTGVGDAVLAGAGESETTHLPHITGITTKSPFAGMAQLIREIAPDVKNVGTLFTPAEINSVLYKDWFAEALANEGLGLVSLPVTSSADLSQAASELCRQDIQLVCQVVDNMTRPGFALIARRAAENNLPVFVFDSDQMREGGVVCLARDYYDAGLEAAEKAVRVLRGENPANIPFSNTRSEKLLYNPELAETYNLVLTPSFLSKAQVFNNLK
jgi:ABC-type uncharacterized transport system substrate-binding protein